MPSIEVDLCLFDLDGTIINTTIAAESAWKRLCHTHRVDPQELFKHSHGSRTEDMFKKFFPLLDNRDGKAVKEFELSLGADYLDTVRVVPGAESLLLSLDVDTSTKAKIVDRKWAIITSGSPYLAFSWFDTLLKKVGKPNVFITGFDVKRGKPDPEGYFAAKVELCKIHGLDLKTSRTVVFEDAPVGIKAGKAIGSLVIGITTTYPKDVLFEAGADYVVEDLSAVTVTRNDNIHGITIDIEKAMSR
ncbi:hypothetical protein HG535_0A04490 [Zygotorulaspora mrakii]|uniref:Uncharacterized protein n=1 Tax=Zygotorulaspora mrakii TaxID=42260 RepID=A0A7H9AXJ4_ZYGMR|nr:uncharacterized protein HG535_0A04490 [Zygotorulaspora mrakii]QLG70509.1 hypothetical protein HG535_0A04490 [Zygotorulaspora mrakii]